MKIQILAICSVFFLQACDSPNNTELYTQEEQKLLTKILNEYKPNSNNCGPRVRDNGEYAESLPNSASIEANLSCLLSGHKNIILVSEIPDFSETMKQLLYKNKICYFYSPQPLGNNYIFYTPAGKLYASLLLKEILLNDQVLLNENLAEDLDIISNDYLTGHLLGYNDQNILDFYNHIAKKFNKTTYNKEKFENDKYASLDWIEINKRDIDEWIKNNSLEYEIQNINFKNS